MSKVIWWSFSEHFLILNTFLVGETIRQSVEVNGVQRLALGKVIGWSRDDNVIRYIQDPKIHADVDGNLYAFAGNGYINGMTSNKIVEPDTDFNGDNGDQTFGGGYASPEVAKFSGTMVYLSNISPVLRGATQTEKVSIIISY